MWYTCVWVLFSCTCIRSSEQMDENDVTNSHISYQSSFYKKLFSYPLCLFGFTHTHTQINKMLKCVA